MMVYMMLALNTHVGAAPVAGAAVQPVARVAAARTQVQGPLNLNKRIIIQVIFSHRDRATRLTRTSFQSKIKII